MKLYYAGLLVALFVFSGCQSQELTPEANPTNTGITDGVLHFASVEAFDSFLKEAPARQEAFFAQRAEAGFVSYAQWLEAEAQDHEGHKQTEPLIEDDFFGRLVNTEGLIHIGAWYLRINKPQERVYAMHEDHYSEFRQALVAETVEDNHLLVFSTSDEVLYLLQDLTSDAQQDHKTEWCNNANSNKDTDNRWFSGTSVNQHDTFLRYHYYGFGYSLKAQAKWRKRTNNDLFNLWDKVNVSNIIATYNREYVVKCYQHPGVEWLEVPGLTTVVLLSNNWSRTFYSGTRKLSAYRAEITIRWTAPNGTRVASKRMNISSGL